MTEAPGSTRFFDHGDTDSTNERAFAALATGDARHGDVHVANAQSAGRGRRGNKWASAPGGLYMSRILLPDAPVPAPALTMSTGLAVLEAVREVGLVAASLKWPNDIMVETPGARAHGPAKLAGILVETRSFDPGAPHYVVGIGVNVAQPHVAVEEREVTSLASEGLSVTVGEMRARLDESLERRHAEAIEHPESTAAAYLMAIGLQGQEVSVEDGDTRRRGRLRTLTLSGIVLAEEASATGHVGETRIPLERARSLRRILPGKSPEATGA